MLTGLLFKSYSVGFLTQPSSITLEIVSTTKDYIFLYQLLILKNALQLDLISIFLNSSFFLSNDSSLCQAYVKLVSTSCIGNKGDKGFGRAKGGEGYIGKDI